MARRPSTAGRVDELLSRIHLLYERRFDGKSRGRFFLTNEEIAEFFSTRKRVNVQTKADVVRAAPRHGYSAAWTADGVGFIEAGKVEDWRDPPRLVLFEVLGIGARGAE